jgi:hypothetical protein
MRIRSIMISGHLAFCNRFCNPEYIEFETSQSLAWGLVSSMYAGLSIKNQKMSVGNDNS